MWVKLFIFAIIATVSTGSLAGVLTVVSIALYNVAKETTLNFILIVAVISLILCFFLCIALQPLYKKAKEEGGKI